jgi:hypothetical protein
VEHLAHSLPCHLTNAVEGSGAPTQVHGRSLPWPDELLTLFSLRMSSHGMSISRVAMRGDARYAMQQLSHARDMGDTTLSLIADELFRWFEARPSGLSGQAH